MYYPFLLILHIFFILLVKSMLLVVESFWYYDMVSMLQKLMNSWYESDGLSLVAILICMCLNLLFTFFGLFMSLISLKAFILPSLLFARSHSLHCCMADFCFLCCLLGFELRLCHIGLGMTYADWFARKIVEVRMIKEWKVYTLEILSKYPWKHPWKNTGNTYINLLDWLIYPSK